eukprot:m.97983 g.97983  ORF g.97983 m.97983 type:complete len:519 (+) comp12412_c0_seq1:66-1622(+)
MGRTALFCQFCTFSVLIGATWIGIAGMWRAWTSLIHTTLDETARDWTPGSVSDASGVASSFGTHQSHDRGGLWVGKTEWPVQIDMFSPDIVFARGGGHCGKLPMRSTLPVNRSSIRALHSRVVIDERCRATVDNIDAGVCIQTDVGRRRYVGCLPSAIIIGFQKCATAELQSWLSAHPALMRWQGNVDQASGSGEADYFKLHGQSSATIDSSWMDKYVKAGFILRRPSDAEAIYTFEKSPNYGSGMAASHVAQMRRLLPAVKLIALVREPAARAYSGFQHTCKKGRVFQIDADIPKTSKNSTRRKLRIRLAGRVILANSKTEAEEGLRQRFGVYSIYREYILPLAYPCPPATFSNFLGLEVALSHHQSNTTKSPPKLTRDHLLNNVFDFRDAAIQHRKATTIVTHGHYSKHLEVYMTHFPREQLAVLFMEDLLKKPLQTLTTAQRFLGVPWFDYAPFLIRNEKGQFVPSFSRSKATFAVHLPVPPSAHLALLEHYQPHNLRLAAFLGDGRTEKHWGLS